MKVCFFGGWDKNYSRYKVMRKGLADYGVEVCECYLKPPRANPVLFRELPLFFIEQFIRSVRLILKQRMCTYDILFVPYPAYFDIPIARILSRLQKKPLVSDLMLSKYVTLISDLACDTPDSLKAKVLKFYDRKAVQLSDIALLDTDSHIELFCQSSGADRSRMKSLPVGSIAECEAGKRADNDSFTVLFYGTYNRLQGVEYILQAADLLRARNDIHFLLIGSGPTLSENKELAKRMRLSNVEFIDSMISYKSLIENICEADLCLGIFGNNEKAKAVIPNKVYDALAVQKPIITSDTRAIHEAGLNHLKEIYLCEPANPERLARAIVVLENDKNMQRELASKGHDFFEQHYSTQEIGRMLIAMLESVLNQKI